MRATASVHHQELIDLTQDENTLRDRLQQSMSGADRGTQAARKKLEDAIRRYKTEGAKNPGYLKVLHADVERLSEQVRGGETGTGAARGRSASAGRDARGEGAARRRAGRAARGRRQGRARRWRWPRALRRRPSAMRSTSAPRSCARRSASSRRRIRPASALPVLRTTVEHLRQLEFRLSEMRAEMAAEPDLSGYDVAIPDPRWRPWLVIGAVLLVAGTVRRWACGFVANAALVGARPRRAHAGRRRRGPVRSPVRRRQRRMTFSSRTSCVSRRSPAGWPVERRSRRRCARSQQERVEALGSLQLPDLASAERLLARRDRARRPDRLPARRIPRPDGRRPGRR